MNKKEEPISLTALGIASIITSQTIQSFSYLGSAENIPKMLFITGIGAIGYDVIDMLLNSQMKKYDKLFKNCGLINKDGNMPRYKKRVNTDKGYQLIFTHVPGISSDDWNKKIKAISEELDIPTRNIKVLYEHHHIILDVQESELSHEYSFKKVDTKGELVLVCGYSLDGIETIDLTVGEPHVLIAGESGSGKSTLLRGIITNLILNTDPNDLKLHLIDLKNGAEFKIFERCKNIASFSKNKKEAEKILYKINAEIDKRYNLFYEKNCVDIKEYNQKYPKHKMCREVVIIDEFADIKDEKDSIEILETVSAKARACGIHLIISTQRPDSKVLTGRIKANVANVIGLKTMNEINSRIIIDHSGLELLRGQGHGILRRGGKEKEIQAMNLTPRAARDLVALKIENRCEPVIAKGDNYRITKIIPNRNNKINTFKRTEKQTEKIIVPQAGEVRDLSFLEELF